MQAKITKRTVDATEPLERDRFLWDTEVAGFGLKVTPAGARVYVLQYRAAARLRRYTIGKHGSPWTPESARVEAKRLLAEAAAGQDPAERKKTARSDITVSELCDLYLSQPIIQTKAGTPKKPRSIYTDRSNLNRHVKPLIGNKRVRAISREDVQRLLQDIALGKTAADEKTGFRGRAIVRGGAGIATRTVAVLGAVFGFAVEKKLRSDNPVAGVKLFKGKKLDRFLSPKELATLGEALGNAERSGTNPVAIAAIRFLVLSGCRKSEALTLEWRHVDYERSCLRLSDSKTGAKVVPLGAPALELLASLPRWDASPYVFPGSRGSQHLVGLQRVWEQIRSGAKLSGVRLHDLRHSFASVGAASGDSLLIIGKLLGHSQPQTTARYAHLASDPVRAAADRISAQIAAAMTPSFGTAEIVDLPQRKRHPQQ